MSGNDFIIVDSDKEEESAPTEEKKEVTVSENKEKKQEDEYEKVCFMCHIFLEYTIYWRSCKKYNIWTEIVISCFAELTVAAGFSWF